MKKRISDKTIEIALRNYLFRLVELDADIERGMRHMLRNNDMIIDSAAAIVEEEKKLKLRGDLPPEIRRNINERIAEREKEQEITPLLLVYFVSPNVDSARNKFNAQYVETEIQNKPYILNIATRFLAILCKQEDYKPTIRPGIPAHIVEALKGEWDRQQISMEFPHFPGPEQDQTMPPPGKTLEP